MAKKLFDIDTKGYDNYIYPKKHVISREMIVPQVGDYIVKALEDVVTKIFDYVSKYKVKPEKASRLWTQSEFKGYISELNRLVTDRFGFNTLFIHASGFCVIPLFSKGYNVLGQQDLTELIEEIKKGGNKYKPKAEPTSLDQQNAINTWFQSLLRYDEALGKGLKIDLNKAKIIGLNNDIICQIGFDVMANDMYDMTPREAVACILHEIGHFFTYIEYNYRCVHNTTIAMDTFLTNIRVKNKSVKESLFLAYESVTNDKSLRQQDPNTITLAVILLDNLHNRDLINQKHAGTDSEALADNFATKFGIGADLVSGLDKIWRFYDQWASDTKPFVITRLIISVIEVVLAVIAISSGIMIIAAVIPLLYGLLNLVVACLVLSSIRYIQHDSERIGEADTYDNEFKRFGRVRLDIIRTLRTTSLPKEQVQALIAQIEQIDQILRLCPEKPLPIGESIYRFFNGNKVEMKRIEQITEELMENDLYYAAEKLKARSY